MKKRKQNGHKSIAPKWLKEVGHCSLRIKQRYSEDVEEKRGILSEESCFEKARKEQEGAALRDQQKLKKAPRRKKELGVPITAAWAVGYVNNSEVSETKGPRSRDKL